MMFRIIALTIALTLSASAQVVAPWQPGSYQPAPSSGYTGPGDIVTFAGWWGLRAYSSAKRGTAAISLCDHTGANCADVLTSASTGVLNAPGTRGSDNCTSLTTCVVQTIYDQTGNGDNCAQATVGNMATFNMTGGAGGGAALVFVRANSQDYSCLAFSTPIQPVSLSTVAERTGTTGSFNTSVSYGGQIDIGFGNSANTAYVYAGGILSATANDSVWHAMQALANGGSSVIYVDGTNTTGSAGSAGTVGNTLIGNGIGGFLDGRYAEGGTIPSDASANFSTLNSNQHSFWGF